jgi:cell wall-associated NlpC family hydrolase
MRTTHVSALLGSIAFALVAGCSAAPGTDDTASTDDAISGSSVASIALANIGKGACSTNSHGGIAFDSSCTGNGGEPEYWCADFARWVWARAGAKDTSELTAAAGSFYTYGERHGTLHDEPAVGDAVVFDYHGGGSADHVAIVAEVATNGDIETVSGDWGGASGSEAHFSSTSRVVHNYPAYRAAIGSEPAIMGMRISGFIAPVR